MYLQLYRPSLTTDSNTIPFIPLLIMPLSVRWSAFNKDNVLTEPNHYGIYELGDNNGQIMYIGQGRLKDRLNSHFIGGSHPIGHVAKYRRKIIGRKQRAEERERAELGAYARAHDEDLPPYNKRFG